MSLDMLFTMRHELLLIVVILLILLAELLHNGTSKKGIQQFALILFGLHTLIGFIPFSSGTLFGSELFGGMYVNNSLVDCIKNILNIGVLIVLFQANAWLQTKKIKFQVAEFYLLLLSTLLGMYFMVSSANFLMFYLGLELASIPIASLAAYEKWKEKSAEAGVKFILLSALSSGVLLYGLALIYGTTGSLYFSEITNSISATSLTMMGFIFFFSGMAFKLSLVPFHLWTADVYEGSPTSVTAYLSVISKGAAAFAFTFILMTVFWKISDFWQLIVYAITVTTITIGNLFALRQQNLKRFFAFSSISQAGFLLLGVISNSGLGISAVVFYILVYIVSNLAVFGVIASIENKTGKLNMDDYNGLYHTNPKLSLLMTLALFSLAGIPPVAGYFGKFFLFTAAAKEGYYILVLIALINTIISLYYYLLIVKAMFINKNETPIETFRSDWAGRVGMVLCLAGMVVIGFYSNIFTYILQVFS